MSRTSTRSRNIFRRLVVNGVNNSKTAIQNDCLIRLYDADAELKAISRELDSFDGKKDPIRCNLLVNRLRTSQDKVISLLFQLMDECNCERASRDYRMKFPDEILLSEGSESLNGQIWFGAECLSAGSNILNHTKESTMLRPMAKTLTTHLDSLRNDLRDLVIEGEGASRITPDLIRKMATFDKIFTNFEYEYVRTMLPIRTVAEIEKLQEVAVLFSETLIDCLKRGLIKQTDIDEFQPIVMIAIPRLAIVRGLLYKNENPIYTKRKSQMCSLFQPFHGPLHSIRKLLRILEPNELFTLEKMLADDQTEVEDSRVEELDKFDSSNQEMEDPLQMTNEKLVHNCSCDVSVGEGTSDGNYTNALMRGLDYPVGQKRDLQFGEVGQSPSNTGDATCSTLKCNELSNSNEALRNDPLEAPPSSSSSSTVSCHNRTMQSKECQPTSSRMIDGETTCRGSSDSDAQVAGLIARFQQSIAQEPSNNSQIDLNCDTDLVGSTARNVDRFDSKIPETNDEVVIEEIFVKQTQQLIHRLFVSISGVADQLQSNFASDLRFILRHIFVSEIEGCDNSSDQDGDEIRASEQRECVISDGENSDTSLPIETAIEAQEVTDLVDLTTNFSPDYDYNQMRSNNAQEDAHSQSQNNRNIHIDSQMSPGGDVRLIQGAIDGQSEELNQVRVDRGDYYPDHMTSPNEPSILESERQRQLIMRREQHIRSVIGCRLPRSHRQIGLDGSTQQSTTSERRSRHHGSRSRRPRGPPIWVPDQLVVACSCCNAAFTLFRRRHHCRACGQIFCGDCSKFTKELNYWGYSGPVRVCEACFNQP